MLLAHLADLHLGYRAYHRLAPGGINARERDVALAFRAALDRIIELGADLVLVAGDVFHTVRPSNAAIADAFRQFVRLRASLPGAPVVIIAGNHDSPRAVETGSILRLFAEIPGVHVVDDRARRVYLEALDTSVLCLPHNALAGGEAVAMEPDPEAGTNILMLHGTVTGGGAEEKLRFVSEYGGAKVEATEIRPERWDYVALGHYHIATELAPNMWYAGGIERTSTNIWEEAETEKGFLTYDLGKRRATFHPIPTRPVVDLPRLSARVRPLRHVAEEGEPYGDVASAGSPAESSSGGAARAPEGVSGDVAGTDRGDGDLAASAGREPGSGEPGLRIRGWQYVSPTELDAMIRQRVESVPGGVEGKIIRLVIEDVPRELFRELDHRQIREYKARALHFHLDARRPEIRRVLGYGAPYRRRSLDEEVESFLKLHWQPSTAEIEAERLVTLAKKYLAEAGRGDDRDPLVESGAGA
ncbi:MAG TPA: DNA repair exonuclease [Longimicrobiales bacterium]|nr:DNA repair exonuclease [Longimicrobiales bacterium]